MLRPPVGLMVRMPAARLAVALALAWPMSGCVAVVAVPALVGGGLLVRDNHRVRAATRVPRPAPAAELKTDRARVEAAAIGVPGLTVTKLTDLPAPSGPAAPGTGPSPFAPFTAYALAQAQGKPQSALLRSGAGIASPVRRACPSATPAVIIDLDNGSVPFAPDHAHAPDPALAGDLAKLREAGTVVLWITRLPAERAPQVAQWVRGSGLDPEAQDQFLLLRNDEDRKQALREDANRDVCVVALAGTARGDFDELYDYLRDPSLALGLEPMFGAGWFLIPPVAQGVPAASIPVKGAESPNPAP